MAASHGNVFVITSRKEWDSKLFEANTNGKVVVVDFTATWCAPCKFMAPIFAGLSEKHPELIFVKVDVDDLSDIAKEYEVHAMPTFLFLKDGEQVERLVGANKVELEKKAQFFASQNVAVA
uniref:Thioredoxin H-type n=1 Tax=Hymenophyllum caudiculatum TaxID=295381 RepID=A0A2P1JJ75_9MONI|nr:thioredoxin H-type [Hymenophyllum caudiculatum]